MKSISRLATLISQSPSKTTVPKSSKFHAAAFEEDGDTDVLESMKRPSLLRKHLKLPRNSTQRNFQTPMNDGRHWDISDGEVDISSLQSDTDASSARDRSRCSFLAFILSPESTAHRRDKCWQGANVRSPNRTTSPHRGHVMKWESSRYFRQRRHPLGVIWIARRRKTWTSTFEI